MTDEFEQPTPGGWMLLGDHFPGALTAEYQRLYAETCPPGMAAYMERYGVLARTLDVAFVHGHLYITPVPLAGPRQMRRPPPRAMVWLMAGSIRHSAAAHAPRGEPLPSGRGGRRASGGSVANAPSGCSETDRCRSSIPPR